MVILFKYDKESTNGSWKWELDYIQHRFNNLLAESHKKLTYTINIPILGFFDPSVRVYL